MLEEVVDFCLRVGLPVSLEDIGVEDASREELEGVAEAACVEGETIHNMPIEIQPAMHVDAMIAADAFGRQRRAALEGEARLPAVANWSGQLLDSWLSVHRGPAFDELEAQRG